MGKPFRRERIAQRSRDERAAMREAEVRPVAKEDRYPALSGLRGLAALGVFAVHAYALARYPQIWPGHEQVSFLLAWPLRMGWAGVDVFFTLSAFLLALPFARAQMDGAPPPDLRGYAVRRLLRIVPAYALQLLVLLALIAIGAAASVVTQPITATRLLLQPVFLYGIGWPGVLPMQWPLVASWWTLPVELGFYALLPWFARWLRPGRWQWLLIGIAFAWCWRALLLWTQPFSPANQFLVEHLPGRIDQFLIGMLAAYACVRAPRWLQAIAGWRADTVFVASAMAFVLLPALGYAAYGAPMDGDPHPQPLMIGWHGYASVAVATMLLACARGTRVADRLLGTLPLRLLGRISYGFYLWHLPVLLWMQADGSISAADGPVAFMLYGLLFSLAAALLSWWIVERPALRLAAGWFPPQPGTGWSR